MTDEREELILDLTDEWHLGVEESMDYTLVGWLAHKLGISVDEANVALYGDSNPNRVFGKPRSDGAVL